MKILAINGSPKGKKSVTYLMVDELLKGAQELGAETDHVLLSQKKIHHCMGCFSCWTKTPGKCIFDDDMKTIPSKECDILIFATPLFVDNVSGLLKNYLDRSIKFGLPFMERDAHGEAIHVAKDKKFPKLVVLSNCGFPEQSHFVVLKTLFRRMARNMHTEVIAEIYRGAGPLLKVDDRELEPIINNYKSLLRRAGRETVQNGALSHDLQQDLEKPLIPHDHYLQSLNSHFERGKSSTNCLMAEGRSSAMTSSEI